jgi:hypothetical protein
MTSLLAAKTVPLTELSSKSHLHFAMEVIGQSFNLPIENDSKIIIGMRLPAEIPAAWNLMFLCRECD